VLELRPVGDVARDPERPASHRARGLGGRSELLLRARGADDVRAHLGEGEGDPPPDPTAGAGHDRDLVGQEKSIEEAHDGRIA